MIKLHRFALILATTVVSAAEVTDTELERRLTQTVRPLVATYCVGCHSGANAAAQFDLRPYTTVALVVRDHPRWALVAEKLTSMEMPPKQVKQPTAEERQQIVEWVEAMRHNEAQKHAGDPGPVMVRRLSNAEYNYSIRDLTGVDIRPTREFPVDPSNPAGFDNSGESLSMSPALLNKYLQAARQVSSHLALKPAGSVSRRTRCWLNRIARSTRFNGLLHFTSASLPTMPTIFRRRGATSIGPR